MSARAVVRCALWAAVTSLLATLAWAEPSLQTQVSSRRPGVGETFTVTLNALVDGGTELPMNARLPVPPGLVAHGPSIGAQSRISIVNGQVRARVGISATWSITASRPGTYRIGPGSVTVQGKRYSDNAVTVEVVPERSPPSLQNPLDPFSLFPRVPGLAPPEDDDALLDLLPPFPPELRVDEAPDALAFVRAVVTPKRAVVGEQLTLAIYAYGRRGPFRETFTSEPSREAFLAHTLLENSYAEPLHQVPIAGSAWHAKKIREMALFPIRSGQLTIGAMRMGFDGRGYPSEGQHKGLIRYSQPLEVLVSEPPLAGRPAGYTIGDVGRFTLAATVSPREVPAGESVSVVAKIEGTGNVPFALKTPQQHGVQWLEPNHYEKLDVRGTKVGGLRKLTYAVRLAQAGEVELGELTLPYYDAERGRYEVARAELGRVLVRPSSNAASVADEPESDALAGLLQARSTLRAEPPRRSDPLTDRPWFLWLLLAGPALVLGSRGAQAGLGRLLTARAGRKSSLAAQAQRALAAAKQAEDAGDAAEAASRAESALWLAIEHATGLKARALLRTELPTALGDRGLEPELVEQLTTLLARADDARFVGSAPQQSFASELRALVERLTSRTPAAEERSGE
ncbi:MAG: BatD family protein [Polyangiaceae bacterium]|nr:BatD family protein [Polyangiaceae bacterium]